jgi:hypothetical protein
VTEHLADAILMRILQGNMLALATLQDVLGSKVGLNTVVED